MSNLEQEQNLEFLFEHDEESNPVENEFEDADHEFFFENGSGQSYGERFYEVASRESESSYEFERGMGEVLDDMEREYFFGGLGKRLKSFAKKGIQRLGKKALQVAGGNLKGILKNAAKMGLNAALPGSGAALSAMGFEVADDKEAWDGFAGFSREAFDTLADEVAKSSLSLNPNDLGALSSLASRAFNQSLQKIKGGSGGRGATNVRRVTANRGDTIVIKVV